MTVSSTEMRIEPKQPSRLEKKKNMLGYRYGYPVVP
ncbi:hypothetical protein DHODJN_14325 [Methylorubrum extorquens]